MWESALENSTATHRQGVIIFQPIQKLSLWRLIFKLNCWSPVVITIWLHLLLRTHVRKEVFATHTGLDCGTGPGGPFSQRASGMR